MLLYHAHIITLLTHPIPLTTHVITRHHTSSHYSHVITFLTHVITDISKPALEPIFTLLPPHELTSPPQPTLTSPRHVISPRQFTLSPTTVTSPMSPPRLDSADLGLGQGIASEEAVSGKDGVTQKGPKLVHLTASRPKRAGARKASRRQIVQDEVCVM